MKDPFSDIVHMSSDEILASYAERVHPTERIYKFNDEAIMKRFLKITRNAHPTEQELTVKLTNAATDEDNLQLVLANKSWKVVGNTWTYEGPSLTGGRFINASRLAKKFPAKYSVESRSYNKGLVGYVVIKITKI